VVVRATASAAHTGQSGRSRYLNVRTKDIPNANPNPTAATRVRPATDIQFGRCTDDLSMVADH
jgi:hypothetical protein